VANLEGKTALVSGASRGIGKAVALALAGAGCNVVVNYLKEREAAEQVAASIRKLSRGCKVHQADVSIPSQAKGLVTEAEGTFGPVDILVNNAGIAQSKPIQDIELSDWEHVLRVNLTSAWCTLQPRPIFRIAAATCSAASCFLM